MPGRARLERRTRGYLRDGRAPVPAREATSRVMSANRAKDTGPEVALRRELRTLGLNGYRLHRRTVPGRPDLSFGPQRLAVFVHGCFWHRCPRCRLPLPKTHTEFWRRKFAANRARDARKICQLKRAGWRVLTIWECEMRDDPAGAAREVRRLVRSRPRSRPGRSGGSVRS